MADLKLTADVSEVVKARREIRKWSRETKDSLDVVNSRMKIMGATSTVAFKKLGDNAAFAGKKVNRMGMRLQQVGYQVGDFAVQLQGGTNAAVALGQQGSQLLGIFGPAGALIGAGLAIGTAFAAPLLDATKKAEDLHAELKSMLETISSESTSTASLMEMSFTGPLEQVRKDLILTKSLFKELNQEAKDQAFATSIMPVLEGIGKILDESKSAQTQTKGMILPSLVLGPEEIATLQEADKVTASLMEKLANAGKGPAEDLGKTIRSVFLELEKTNNLTPDLIRAFQELENETGLMLQTEKELEAANKKRLEQLKKITENEKQARAFAEETIKIEAARLKVEKTRADALSAANLKINNTLELLRIEKELGKDSLHYLKEKQRQDMVALTNRLRALGIDESLIEKSQDLLLLSQRKSVEIKKQIDDQKELNKHLKLAKQFEVKPTGGRGADPRTMGGSFLDWIVRNTPEDDDKKGGKTPAEKLAEEIKALQDRATLENKLVGLFENERDVKSELIQLQQEYGDLITVDKMAEIQAALDLEQAAKKQQQALQDTMDRQKEFADLIANSMGNSMMSIVEGTQSVKDAFRSMAADIVKHLYKVLVVQQMINAIGGAIGGPVGGALEDFSFNGGGYTGNGPRSGGLDGRGGFMAMMHPQETVVDHTKGQSAGGDNVVINQSFNFAANGDDSVKKIIAQAAPQIAQMTKNSMLNDRRRGGTTKAVFG